MSKIVRIFKFIFSLEFILGLKTVISQSFKNEVFFIVKTTQDLEYILDIVDYLKIKNTPFKVVLFEKDSILLNSDDYIYFHPYLTIFLKTKLVITPSAQIKRKMYPFVKKLAHVPHSIVSLHMIYPEKAFNEFDYIFCSGKHHLKEVDAINMLYGCAIKGLKSGYTKLDTLYKISKNKIKNSKEKKVILLAPSWGNDNILESIGEPLMDAIISKGHILIIRPHPVFFHEKKNIIKMLKKKCDNRNIFLENPSSGNSSFFEADMMISDYSGASFEYAFLREKPVLFVEVPRKILNVNYESMNIEPIEISLREKLGVVSKPNLKNILESLELLLKDSEEHQKNIIKIRNGLLYNYTKASETITTQINEILVDI